MEASLISRTGLAFESIPAAGLHGVGLKALPGNLWRLAKGVPAARRIVRQFDPDVIFFTGGFVGVPVALAGRHLPKMVYVPDIEPALALKLIGNMADVIAVTTEESRAYHSVRRRVVVTGYPTRHSLRTVDRTGARDRLGLDVERPVVLVFGGSRGARSINEALWGCLEKLLESTQILHITGTLDWPRVEDVRSRFPIAQLSDYHAHAYLHEEMADALVAADLVVSRAGAATLGEFTLLGLPAILVPYPHAWRYQKVNAQYLVRRGAAVSLADGSLGEELLPTILTLLGDKARLNAMAQAARKLATPEAAHAIASEIESLGEGKGGTRA